MTPSFGSMMGPSSDDSRLLVYQQKEKEKEKNQNHFSNLVLLGFFFRSAGLSAVYNSFEFVNISLTFL